MAKPRRLPAEVRAKLLGLIKSGNDLEASCSALGLSPKVVQQDAALMGQVNEAYRAATGRLRSKLLEVALKGDDARILAQLLTDREAAQARMVEPAQRMDLTELRESLLAEVERHRDGVPGKLCAILKTLLDGEVAKVLSFEQIEAIQCALGQLGDPAHATRSVPNSRRSAARGDVEG